VRVRSRKGVRMKMLKGKDIVYFTLYDEDLFPYGIDVNHVLNMKPFTEKLLFDLMEAGEKEYGKKLECNIRRIFPDAGRKAVVIGVPEKSNIYFIDNEFMEEERIIDGIQGMFQFLPDDRIDTGIMDVEEKRAYLELLRSEAGREIIRQEFLR